MKCNETRKCVRTRAKRDRGNHCAYGALYRNVLHDIPMEVQVILRMINGLLA